MVLKKILGKHMTIMKTIKSDIAVFGLSIMGQNLAINIANNDFNVVVANRDANKTQRFLDKKTKNVMGVFSIKAMIDQLKTPRCVILMIKAGKAVDEVIAKMVPLLSESDIIVDGGNSNFTDTERRIKQLREMNIHFIGMGISGGSEGALYGPSIMPSGSKTAWNKIKTIITKIAAKNDNGEQCCKWIGEGGSGHFVKMVHNGIEYGVMQLICETYNFMKTLLRYDNEKIADIFNTWSNNELNCYLLDITVNILKFKDHKIFLVDNILDIAEQKGSGKWLGIHALKLNIPLTTTIESLFARYISSNKDMRLKAERIYKSKLTHAIQGKHNLVNDLKQALLFGKIIAYIQGYIMMQHTALKYKWNLEYKNITEIWKSGCIIRSSILYKIQEAFDNIKDPQDLLFDKYFVELIKSILPSTRKVITQAIDKGLPMPVLASAVSFFDSITTGHLPMNLLQAQRDYFGAHGYQMINSKSEKKKFTNWKQN